MSISSRFGAGQKTRKSSDRKPKQTLLVVPESFLEVTKGVHEGIICRVVHPEGAPGEKVVLKASPDLVKQKNESQQFPASAKSTDGTIHKRFYLALMKPNPSSTDSDIRLGKDVVRTVVKDTGTTVEIPGSDVLAPVYEIAPYGFNIFSRGERRKVDPLDPEQETVVPAQEIIKGYGYVQHYYADATAAPIRTFRLVYTPTYQSEEALFDDMRKSVKTRYGKRVYFHPVGNEEQCWQYVYPVLSKEDREKSSDEQERILSRLVNVEMENVEKEIQMFKDQGLNLGNITIYVEETLRFSPNDADKQMEQFMKDAEYGAGLSRAFEAGQRITVGLRNPETGEVVTTYQNGYAAEIIVSRTFYERDGEILPGSLRSATVIGKNLRPIPSLLMSEAAYEAQVAKRAEAGSKVEDSKEFQQETPAPVAPAAAATPAPALSDMDDDIPF